MQDPIVPTPDPDEPQAGVSGASPLPPAQQAGDDDVPAAGASGQPATPRRVVAIVGRPNVGKSAFFNRLAGRRVAIVHAESGVTRDRLIHEVEWEGQRFELVDTGGICNLDRAVDHDVILAGTRRQVDAALADAGVVVFVVDIAAGLVPMDLEVARLLRHQGRAVFVAANKADSPDHDDDAAEFDRLGFPVFAVSALHNRGFDELMSAVLPALPPAGENPTIAHPIRVAIVGRPNVGKSSYVNRLLRSERVIVSDVPGTTRDSIDIPFAIGRGEQARHYVLVDTAGMRAVGKIDSAVERFSLFRTEHSIRTADVVVLMLDAEHGPTLQDKKIAALINEHARGCVMLMNKWDRQLATQKKCTEDLGRLVPFMGHCPLVFASALTGYNIRKSVEAIDTVAAQVKARLPTGVLNRALLDAWERSQPQPMGGRRMKLFYSTQVGDNPVRIRSFVNNPDLIRPSYRQYLVRSLREKFGLDGAPVLIELVKRGHPKAGRDRNGKTEDGKAEGAGGGSEE